MLCQAGAGWARMCQAVLGYARLGRLSQAVPGCAKLFLCQAVPSWARAGLITGMRNMITNMIKL